MQRTRFAGATPNRGPGGMGEAGLVGTLPAAATAPSPAAAAVSGAERYGDGESVGIALLWGGSEVAEDEAAEDPAELAHGPPPPACATHLAEPREDALGWVRPASVGCGASCGEDQLLPLPPPPATQERCGRLARQQQQQQQQQQQYQLEREPQRGQPDCG